MITIDICILKRTKKRIVQTDKKKGEAAKHLAMMVLRLQFNNLLNQSYKIIVTSVLFPNYKNRSSFFTRRCVFERESYAAGTRPAKIGVDVWWFSDLEI